MANDKDQDQPKNANDEKNDAKSAAQARVAEIKRKKAEAKKAQESDNESKQETGDAKSTAQKRVAEIKRKKAEAKKAQESGNSENTEKANSDDSKSAAQKRVAEIKRKKTEKAASSEESTADSDDAKSEREKKIAAMKAKARAKKQAQEDTEKQSDSPAKPQSKSAAAIAKAKAAKAKKAKAKPEEEQKPSPNQPLLDKYVKVIRENIGDDVLEDSYINRMAKDVPTLVAKADTYYKIAEFLKLNERLSFDYLSQIHGTDYETHLEVYAHLYSFRNRQPVALKVKIDRDRSEIDSITPLWKGADWPEREAYDLLGIVFKGHPNMTRIMMPDDWVGHPLRKDYEPHDVEV